MRSRVVLDEGGVHFEGTPAELAELATGRVWVADRPEPSARLSWRMGTGVHRLLGYPPAGAQLVAPTIEDGYLLLVGTAGGRTEERV